VPRSAFAAWFAGCLVAVATVAAIPSQAQSPACAAAAHYKIVRLPLRPARINRAGVIAGTTEDHSAARWTQKTGLHEVELPPGLTADQALGLNNAGDITGAATQEGTNQAVAFVVAQSKFSRLSAAPSRALAINDAGDAVGQGSPGPVLWHRQKAITLAGCCGGVAHAINSRGQVVGQLNDQQGHYHAFRWDAAHKLRSIPMPPAADSTALAINNSGDILLQSFIPNAVYLRRARKNIELHLAPEVASQPLALNDCDVIVGEFGAASDFYHAFVWDQANGFRDMNQLIGSGTGWNLESALDVNDRGEIIGVGDFGNEQDVGVLLVPDRDAKTTKDSVKPR